METIERSNLAKMKEDIKNMSQNQKFLKNQRKTEKLVGERVMEPWQATMQHASNREKLRIMYAAYGIMRGKSLSQIENKYDEENHPLKEFEDKINKVISAYKVEEEVKVA
jgi:hypothetical protein